MIKNVIFDIGNVLLTYNPAEYLKHKYTDDTAKGLFDTIFASEEWLCLDRGTLTIEAACEIFIRRRPDLEQEIPIIMHEWYELMKPVTFVWDALFELRDLGFHLYFLSNMGKAAAEYITRKYQRFCLFTGGMFSCDVNWIKPEHQIYEKFLAKYSLQPDACVFFDDSELNVIAARKMGIKSFIFSGADSFENNMHAIRNQGRE